MARCRGKSQVGRSVKCDNVKRHVNGLSAKHAAMRGAEFTTKGVREIPECTRLKNYYVQKIAVDMDAVWKAKNVKIFTNAFWEFSKITGTCLFIYMAFIIGIIGCMFIMRT